MATFREFYDDMLDEIGLPPMYSASQVLKEVDPIAYDSGFLDFMDDAERFQCEECGETLTAADIESVDGDDSIRCLKCRSR